MDFKCSYNLCDTLPMVYCNCSNFYIFLCGAHLQNHIDEKPEKSHPIKPLYKKIPQDHKANYVESLRSLQSLISSTSNAAKSSLQATIENLKNLDITIENYFNNQILSLQKLIDVATSQSKEVNIFAYKKNIFAKSSFQQHVLKVKENATKLNEQLNSNLKNITELLQNVRVNWQDDTLDYNGNANLDEHLYYFNTGTKTFAQFNVDELVQKNYNTNVNEPQGSSAPACQVPGEKLFYCGGYNPSLDTTYLIDLKTWKAEPLSKCKVRYSTSATYFNGFVYIFGSIEYYNRSSKNCDKFDLTNKRWINLADSPFTAQETNVLPYPLFFILTGYGANALWKYGIEKDDYQKLSFSLNVEHNLFLRDNRIAYFITKRDLYVCYDIEGNNWSKCLKSLSMDCIEHCSKPITRGKNVYFISSLSRQVCRFDLETLDLYLVKKV